MPTIPNVKYATFDGVGDGVQTQWEFNFSGGYISQDHVKGYVTDATTGLSTDLVLSWVGPNTVQVVPAVPDGDSIVIYRDTPKGAPLVDYTEGSIINERNLDITAQQAVFVAAEMVDRTASAQEITTDVAAALTASVSAQLTAIDALAVADGIAATAASAVSSAGAAVATANAAAADAANAVTTAEGIAATAANALSVANTKAALNGDPTQNFNAASLNGGPLGGTRNRLINGDMLINQEFGTTATTPTGGQYISDQWASGCSQPSKLTYQQVADAPAGYKYSTKITVATQYAPGVADYFYFAQLVEGLSTVGLGLGTAAAKVITISLWVKGTVAGTYSCSLRNGAGTRSYTGTIAVTTSWAKQTLTLVGDTTGAWVTDNTAGLVLYIGLGVGSTYTSAAGAWAAGNFFNATGSVNFVNQVAGSTLNITGVRLEEGSVATPEEFVPYADKLRWCQRYYRLFSSGMFIGSGLAFSTNTAYVMINHGVPMRLVPTIGVTGNVQLYSQPIVAVNTLVPNYTDANGNIGVLVQAGATGLISGYAAMVFTNTGSVSLSARM